MTDPNLLSQSKFRFVVKKLPNVSFWVQDVTIPGVHVDSIDSPTPMLTVPTPGGKMEHDDLILQYRLDENMLSYTEIFNWMQTYGRYDTFSTYNSNQPFQRNTDIFSDATLLVLKSSNRPNIEVTFEDLFPVALSELPFTTQNVDEDFIQVTATFKYKLHRLRTYT